MRTWANAIVIRDNWISWTCGSNDGTSGAAIEIDGTVGFARGNTIASNSIEMIKYPYGIKLVGSAQHNTLIGNAFWDGNVSGGIQVAAYRFENGAGLNTVIGEPQNDSGGTAFISDANVNQNFVFAQTIRGKFTFADDQIFNGSVVANGALTVAGRLDQNDGASTTSVVSMVLARWGYGGAIGYWNIQNSGNPTTSRVLAGFNAAQSKTAQLDPGGYQGVVQILSGSLHLRDATNGMVMKDANGHYWRVTISVAGVLTTTDLGTSIPST
jgi:hypothetical protein